MEAFLAFAALHELLWPVLDRLETLAAPQAMALRGALGMSRDPANRFLIGVAVLSLLSGLAWERPVLVARGTRPCVRVCFHASGARLEFRHPLVPAAAYDGSPLPERQAASSSRAG
ncbi:hypothetical protein O7626_30765 [Micromonospora sp. WMMD1102]|uniref:hypothetical protein n=1 Tax=Micromonospora sp. WMMD1102 TaxID=3016105 RepID=UPI002414DE39|nr:hypothetical protein [Micromonospora sp. WMMD1102]MDG4790253.1 hypothetical protein [Micromonospora sp. WMMD1102]